MSTTFLAHAVVPVVPEEELSLGLEVVSVESLVAGGTSVVAVGLATVASAVASAPEVEVEVEVEVVAGPVLASAVDPSQRQPGSAIASTMTPTERAGRGTKGWSMVVLGRKPIASRGVVSGECWDRAPETGAGADVLG